MKCPYCGSPLGLEDEFCSFCGQRNQFAKKHQADMKHFKKEFSKTQQQVYVKTHRFATLTTSLIILFVLIILNIAGFIFFSSSWHIGSSMIKNDISKHADEHRETLEHLIQIGDYPGMSSYFDTNSLFLSDEFDEYRAVVSVADNYYSVFRRLAETQEFREYWFDAENLTFTVQNLTDHLDYIYNPKQHYAYMKEICLTEEKMAIIEKIQEQTTAILIAYGGLTPEEAKELPELSASRQQELLERSLSNLQ